MIIHLLIPDVVLAARHKENQVTSLSRLIDGAESTRRFNAKIVHALFHSLFQRDDIVGKSLNETLPTIINDNTFLAISDFEVKSTGSELAFIRILRLGLGKCEGSIKIWQNNILKVKVFGRLQK